MTTPPKKREPWDPRKHGVSVSCLNLWLQDKHACYLSYIENWEAVESWNSKMKYGNLVQAGLEGYIKTRQVKGAFRFIQTEYKQQVDEYGMDKDITWHSKLAEHTVSAFIQRYKCDKALPLSIVKKSEENLRAEITLPFSNRNIVLNMYIDGEWDDGIMENKCRGSWKAESIAREIKWDLQYNYYLLAKYLTTGTIPSKVWYQHILRPGSFGYRGPRKRKTETTDQLLGRIVVHMKENPDTYFYRFIGRPTEVDISRFSYGCLYPILEAFLDWYEFVTDEDRFSKPNHCDWITPYGLYNPFVMGTEERFRNHRLTGSTAGLRKKVFR